MDKYLVVWPKSEEVMHINYHYTQLGECVDYLDKFFPGQIVTLDCDINNEDIIKFIKENGIKKVIMQVNYENAQNAFGMCNSIKSVYMNLLKTKQVYCFGNISSKQRKIIRNNVLI